MRVKQGWSGEVEPNKWAKVDVELDEGDLGRLLRDHGIMAEPSALSVDVAYSLLEIEAERMVLLKLALRHGYPQQQAVQEISKFVDARSRLIEDIRSSLVPA